MPEYRIYRMKDQPRQQFRWAPHVSGAAITKRKDYEESAEQMDAPTEYIVWERFRGSERPLAVGDVLETESGELRLYKYGGFEPAQWYVPEPKPVAATTETLTEPGDQAQALAAGA